MEQTDTLVHRIADWARRTPDNPALHDKRPDGTWQTLSWSAYDAAVREVARGLLTLGHQPGECVALVGNNRIDWVLCQFGIMSLRGVPAPMYTTLLPDQLAWIVEHAQARIVICDTREQLDKLLTGLAEGRMATVEHLVTMDDLGVDDPRVTTLAALREAGRQQDDAELDARLDALTTDETALLIYTSGTTGTPKAVQLDHGGMIFMAGGILSGFDIIDDPSQYRMVSYLPLCHVAEQLFTNFLHLAAGGQIFFCPDLKAIKDYLVEVRPTAFLGVPRVWEKFQAALEAKLGEATGFKARLVRWARATELAAFRADCERAQQHIGWRRAVARRLVIDKVKTALGLDQLAVAATGAAPISVDTLEFFASLGIIVYEGFGMSETTGVATTGEYLKPRFGTVGRALPGVTVRIADDGEILLKGRNMTRGYLRQPEQTAELLDDEGWLHTGDLGSLDDEGYLKITGRKKDILITAGGKNIAPAEMEGHIKQIFGISQAVVVGDRQPYLSALVTLDPEVLDQLASRIGVTPGALETMSADPRVLAWVQQQVEEGCNARVARYQTIKKVRILPVEFSVDSGEVTPTMKIKRNVVSEKYARDIEALYAEA